MNNNIYTHKIKIYNSRIVKHTQKSNQKIVLKTHKKEVDA